MGGAGRQRRRTRCRRGGSGRVSGSFVVRPPLFVRPHGNAGACDVASLFPRARVPRTRVRSLRFRSGGRGQTISLSIGPPPLFLLSSRDRRFHRRVTEENEARASANRCPALVPGSCEGARLAVSRPPAATSVTLAGRPAPNTRPRGGLARSTICLGLAHRPQSRHRSRVSARASADLPLAPRVEGRRSIPTVGGRAAHGSAADRRRSRPQLWVESGRT